MPEISIIVPVYKTEKYLERCVKSILNQSFKDFELILVDDGSPDECFRLCEQWKQRDERVEVIHKDNGGLSSARNAGLMLAKGKYIGFVDSDDWIAQDTYELLYKAIKKYDADYSAVDMVITQKEILSVHQPIYRETVYNKDELFHIFFRITTDDIKYCVCDKLYKAETLLKIRFKEGFRFEDIDFNFNVLQKCDKAVLINQVKYFYYYNEKGITRNALIQEDLQLLQIWDDIEEICNKKYKQYSYYAHMNHIRANMGILGKYAKFGVSEKFIDWNIEKKVILKNIRKNFLSLYKWRMSTSRKLLLIVLCINPELVAIPFRIKRILK